jgi:putative PEP-CTERM system histidine kinase
MPAVNSALMAWSYGLAAVAFTAFALDLLRQGYASKSTNRSATLLVVAIASSALWAWVSLVDLFSDRVAYRLMAAAADVLRYAGWCGFLLLVLRTSAEDHLPRGGAWLAPAAVTVLTLALALQGLATVDILVAPESRIVLLSALSLPVLGMVLVEQLFRNVQEDARWNAKPLCLGLAGIFVFDLYLFSEGVLFGRMDPDALGVRGIVHALMIPLLMVSMKRRHDWISRLRMSRQAAFQSATLMISGLYLVFISSVGYYVRYFGGDWGRALQLALVFAALVLLLILALSGSVRAKLRVLLGKHFFRYRYDYREEWLRFTQTLLPRHTPQEMGQQVVRGLADMLESPGGGLWTRAMNEAVFTNAGRWNTPAQDDAEPMNSPFSQFLTRSGWVIDLDEYRNAPQRYGALVLPSWLLAMPQAWLIVPLRVGDELTGFVVLSRARTPMDVNWEVHDLLKTAGRQAASFLAQMQATEALLEVRKFDAFNRMSAFVVHDLKNIVTQLSLMMKNAKRLHANPEFQQDMLMTVENALDRMRQLMLQLREGATPPGKAFGVDLDGVAQRIAAAAAGRGRQLELQVTDKVVTRGHEERLERVIGHLVQNAFDATDPAGRVWIRLDRAGSQARIEVGDTGCGMSKEFVRDHLFKPFQTTKQAGMGIGAYESFQYVQELGGTIQVHSEPGEGTRVTLLLPVFESRHESDLHLVNSP